MKISIFSAFFPFRGGIAQFNARLTRELVKEHTIKTFTFKKQYPRFLFPGKSQFVASKSNPEVAIANRIVSTFNPFTYFSAAKKITESQADVFITNYWMTFFGPFMGLIGKRNSKMKRIALVHNLVPHEKRFFDNWFNRYFVKHYDGFVVLSDAVQQDILKLKPHAKILFVEHPIYDHFGSKLDGKEAKLKLKINPTKKTLLFFGIIRDYKGLDNLILAMDKLSDDFQLVIAGEIYGDSSKYLELIGNSNKKESIYLFDQFIADEEVKLYFSAADLCVLPYRSATQSGVTAISHYFEVPVLATNVGGLKETITHSKTGWIIDESSDLLISKGIIDYFSKVDSHEVKKAISEVKVERSWKSFSLKLTDFIQSL